MADPRKQQRKRIFRISGEMREINAPICRRNGNFVAPEIKILEAKRGPPGVRTLEKLAPGWAPGRMLRRPTICRPWKAPLQRRERLPWEGAPTSVRGSPPTPVRGRRPPLLLNWEEILSISLWRFSGDRCTFTLAIPL